MEGRPGKIEHYEKQFGIIAIEMGYISPDDLIEALKIQVNEDIGYKTHRLIGEILLENNCITAAQIQNIIDTMFKNRPSV
jgi:hypothetical protein